MVFRTDDTKHRCPTALAARFMYLLQELEKRHHIQLVEIAPRNLQICSAEIDESIIATNDKQYAALHSLQSANGALATNKYIHLTKEAEGVGNLVNSKYSALSGTWNNITLNSSEEKARTRPQTGKQLLRVQEVELLRARMQILEHETKALKREVIEIVEERNKLLNEICKEFETIGHSLRAETGEEPKEASDVSSAWDNLPSTSRFCL